ncbi:hypothetical protein ACI797_17755 [Geodermatophilus sp. SYSU D00691]
MSAENRLTVDQLAALSPGDQVTIETAGDVRRPRRATGTVVRFEGPHIVVSCRSPRGVAYVHHFGRRDGIRAGGGRNAELVNAAAAAAVTSKERRRQLGVDAAQAPGPATART